MTIVLIILCILLLIPFIGIILEGLGYLVMGAIAIGLIVLLVLGANALGFLLCSIIVFIAMILIAIHALKSDLKTWEETVLYCATLFLPLLLSWLTTWVFTDLTNSIKASGGDYRNIENIAIMSFATALTYTVFSFIRTLAHWNGDIENDIKNYSKFIVKFYCAVPIMWCVIFWLETVGLILVIIFIFYCIYKSINSDKGEDKTSNKSTSEEH
ncbi:hypothetical protein [Bartonella sp. MM73XJBT]|uniref:hypothetical protein n=1 Tax=Bartonella sp. MM73XJBT TaxID=3019095 RepID=UPI002360A15B|nr:hypothetical protein [Bartonella sp. MM73XJBT]